MVSENLYQFESDGLQHHSSVLEDAARGAVGADSGEAAAQEVREAYDSLIFSTLLRTIQRKKDETGGPGLERETYSGTFEFLCGELAGV